MHKKTARMSKLDASSKNSCAQFINLSTCRKCQKTRKNRVVHKVIHFIHSGYPLFHWWINPVNPKQMFCIKSINLTKNEKNRICKTKEIVWQFFVQRKKLLLFSKIVLWKRTSNKSSYIALFPRNIRITWIKWNKSFTRILLLYLWRKKYWKITWNWYYIW